MSEFKTESERQSAIAVAEQLSRREESRMIILRSKLTQNPNDAGAKEAFDVAEKDSIEANRRLDELNGITEVKDLSGAVRGLSDSAGNFAPNIAVAQAGGTGVAASNSVAGSEQQASDPGQVQTPAAATAEQAKLAAEEAVKAAEQAKQTEADAAKQTAPAAAPATPVAAKK